MKFDSLKVTNFRNYDKVSLKFSPYINIIYGKNGSGKTNIVEALYVLALTRSFRTKDDINLIKKDELSTKIEGKVKINKSDNYQVIINKEGKKVKINNIQEYKISNYISNINVILYQPDDQMLLKLAPSVRRKMINIEISQLNKNYIYYLNNYNKILKQRNFYLREMMINSNASVDYLNILTDKLIQYGMNIYEERKKFFAMINENISNIYNQITQNGNILVKYESDYDNKTYDDLINMYKAKQKYDINMGKTNIGIQHDDFDFILDGNSIKEWGSVGEQKNAIFAFKLSEIEIFKKIKGSNPILILDDIFSELDKTKVKNIVKILNNNIQTFITTTEIERISKNLVKNAKKFKVINGEIKEIVK